MAPRTVTRIEYAAVALALVAGIAHRAIFGWYSPFWLDEAYTGVIASQPDIASLIDWCRHELSGPFFYATIWLWEKIAGDGDLALRLPSLVASLGAVALIAIWGGADRRERRVWAALTMVWLPGLVFVAQARPQALLFLLATAQTIAFLRCVAARASRWLTLWSAVGALMLLTHIYAAAIIGLQGLCLLWTFRDRPRALWPSIAIFAVVAAWLPFQLAFLLDFLKPGMAWYPVSGPAEAFKLPYHLFGVNVMAFAVVAIVAVVLARQIADRRSAGTPLPYSRGEAMVMLSGLIAAVAVFGFGFLRPSFTPRYLIPYMPALLFGLTLILCRTRFLAGLLPSILLVAWAGAAAQNAISYAGVEEQQTLYPLEFQRGSDWLMAHDARRVMFVWDNPASALSGERYQTQVGAFFFRRAGYAAEVRAVHLDHAGQSPARLAQLARARRAAILWVGGSDYPAGLRGIADLACRDFGAGPSKSIACVRR